MRAMNATAWRKWARWVLGIRRSSAFPSGLQTEGSTFIGARDQWVTGTIEERALYAYFLALELSEPPTCQCCGQKLSRSA